MRTIYSGKVITRFIYPPYAILNDVTIVTEKDLQNEAKVQQTVSCRIDSLSLVCTVGPQVYNLILEYSDIHSELFSFGLVFERQILHYISVTVIASKWVTHWIYRHSRLQFLGYTDSRKFRFYNNLACFDFRSLYPSIMSAYNADFYSDKFQCKTFLMI